jgi:hypothetical protein
VLALGVCAVAGAKTFTAISEWAADLTPSVWARLKMARRPPCESTIRHVLQRVDPDSLDRVLSAWLRHQDLATTALYAKVDLTTLRGVAQPWPMAVAR